jgi:hypothetical protein
MTGLCAERAVQSMAAAARADARRIDAFMGGVLLMKVRSFFLVGIL